MKRTISLLKFSYLIFLFIGLNILSSSQNQDIFELKGVSNEVYEAILQFYEYDKQIPFDLQIVERIEHDDYIREKIVFTGINNSRVTGFLAIPKKGNIPHPCVLQMHGMTVSKSDFWEEEYHYGELVTRELILEGYAVLALDMPYHGDRLYENNFESSGLTLFQKGWGYRIRDMVVQSTIEYRRAIDYLETRKDIDANKIGAVGYSLGSVVTFNLTGIDKRIKTSVVCATAVIKPRPFFPPPEYLSGFAPQTFIKAIGERPILILAAKNDEFNCTVEEAEQLYKLLESDGKNLIFYESGHKLPPEHATVAKNWFLNNLD
jgi:predicted esterase